MTPTQTPILTGRDIGQAEHAVRAILDRLLDRAGLTYPQWTILFTIDAAGPLARDELARRQAAGLQVPAAEAEATVDGLVSSGLVAPVDGGPALGFSAAAEAVFRPARQEVARLTGVLYGDLPRADLEATQRTLAEITRRANAHLATSR